ALGFSENQLIKVIEILNLKEGIILIIGPSGSGKTMTLYSCINEIKKTPRCVITVEKVIENHLPGVIQSEINIAEGFGFVHGIHAVLRQDPDVIAVSDIDCSDTAEAVIKISTTGHLVLAGMDAKNAVDAIEKLYAMRINPSLVATNIECLLNQRIVRKICGECKAEYQPLAQLVKDNNIEPQTKFLKGKGCTTCGQRGFSGRTGIFEILFPDENIRSAIAGHLDKESLSPLLKVSPTIREHGIQKVLEGITTLEQVISVTE
ncbi:MAG: ATPase, T2SS/T4P/T4SS family, partial [Elusimicrobiota bacterium]